VTDRQLCLCLKKLERQWTNKNDCRIRESKLCFRVCWILIYSVGISVSPMDCLLPTVCLSVCVYVCSHHDNVKLWKLCCVKSHNYPMSRFDSWHLVVMGCQATQNLIETNALPLSQTTLKYLFLVVLLLCLGMRHCDSRMSTTIQVNNSSTACPVSDWAGWSALCSTRLSWWVCSFHLLVHVHMAALWNSW